MPATPGYAQSKDQVLARLRRVEGQIRGLQRMVDSDTYCIDVLTQISAASAALRGVAGIAASSVPLEGMSRRG